MSWNFEIILLHSNLTLNFHLILHNSHKIRSVIPSSLSYPILQKPFTQQKNLIAPRSDLQKANDCAKHKISVENYRILHKTTGNHGLMTYILLVCSFPYMPICKAYMVHIVICIRTSFSQNFCSHKTFLSVFSYILLFLLLA